LKFKTISYLEGISFLLLLGIAMPLKYIWEMPIYVKVVGWAHGVLFILYFFYALKTSKEENWSRKKLIESGVASLLPFGPFIFEKRRYN
jgi:integral membrane protein